MSISLTITRCIETSLHPLVCHARALHSNERGAEEGMNKLLIFAMVALPLLALLIFFGNEIVTAAQTMWDDVFGGGSVTVVQ